MISATNHYTQTDNFIDPAIGSADLDPKIIDQAIQDIFHIIAKPYLSMSLEDLQKLPPKQVSFHSSDNSVGVGIPEGYLNFIDDKSRETQIESSRYCLLLNYKIKDLALDRFPGNFLLPLHRRLSDFSYPCSSVMLRFEKGMWESRTQEWHFDFHEVSVTIGYSNMKDWNTRVIDEAGKENFCGLSRVRPSKEISYLIDQVSRSAKNGYFYDARETLHRSPHRNEIDENISANSYRLFVRFEKDFYGF